MQHTRLLQQSLPEKIRRGARPDHKYMGCMDDTYTDDMCKSDFRHNNAEGAYMQAGRVSIPADDNMTADGHDQSAAADELVAAADEGVERMDALAADEGVERMDARVDFGRLQTSPLLT